MTTVRETEPVTAANGRGLPFLRVALAAQTLTILLQAVSAGLPPAAPYGALMHDVGSRVVYGAAMLYVVAAVLVWRPGGGSPRHIGYSAGFLVLASVQVAAGIWHVPAVHVPLGVLMFGLSLLALAHSRRLGRS